MPYERLMFKLKNERARTQVGFKRSTQKDEI